MKVRLRWFSIPRLNADHLKMLLTKMEKHEFRTGGEIGFQIVQVRPKYIIGRHVELLRIKTSVTDPLGKVLQSSRVELRSTNFRLGTEKFQLELENPSRSYPKLLNEIVRFADYNLAIEVPRVSCLDWLKSIERTIGPSKAIEVHVDSISITPSILANIAILGADDVRKQIKAACGGKKGIINSISFQTAKLVGMLESNGRAVLTHGFDDDTKNSLQAGLMSAVEGSRMTGSH